MDAAVKPRRDKEILRLLKDHGPISIEMLHRMTEPPMPKKNLRQSLGILKRKFLIDAVSFNAQTTYYQISQALPSREKSASLLHCNPDEIERPLLRKQDWFHNQWCEYWSLSIKRLFPETEIIREHDIGGNEIAKRILQLKERDFDLMPDLLVIFPKSPQSEATYIAFEIERTRKSNERIMRKFRKYLNGTKIDGLIYICDSGRLSETIRELYKDKLVAQSQRIKHYGDHFFLFSDSLDGNGPDLQNLYNANTQTVSFRNWCDYLRTTKWTLRRDSKITI